MGRQVECTIPVLHVSDMARSLRFYTGTLGFKRDWGGEGEGGVASVSRDGCAIMLSSDGLGNRSGSWVWIGMESELFQPLMDGGVTVRQRPMNRPWAYEMQIEDPDGNVLWLGSEPKRDRPFDP